MTKRVRIAHITSTHYPDDVRIYQKEARSLARAGYDVTIVAPAFKDVTLEGVRWHRLPRPHNRLERFTRLMPAAYRAVQDIGAQVVHLHDPELLFLGLMLKYKGLKVIWDVHEDLPLQILTKAWIPPIVRKPISSAAAMIAKVAGKFFDAIIVATPNIARSYPIDKVEIVRNYPILGEYITIELDDYNKRPLHFVYVGGISEDRGINEMVQAIKLLTRDVEAKLLIAGKLYNPALSEKLKDREVDRYVNFLGWRSRREVHEILANARAGLVLLHPLKRHLYGYPTKLFEYMAAGLPVIASDLPFIRSVIEESGAGLLVDPLNVTEIVEAMKWIILNPKAAADMGRRGREAVMEKYNWEFEKNRLINIYRKLCPNSKISS